METTLGVLIVLCAGASFFFALAETALFSLSQWQVNQLAERQAGGGRIVAALLARPQDLQATLTLGNTFANAAILAAALRMVLDNHWELLPTMLALAAVILVGCEVVPKTLAVRQPERWALRVARLLSLFQNTTHPLHRAAQAVNGALLRAAARRTAPPSAVTEAEYQELLELAWQQGTLDESEREIILQIISLDRRTAREVMRPRATMACVSDDATVEEMIAAARKYQHRRLPVHDETSDTIVGLLNTRALLSNPSADLSEVIEFPSFVPESMNLLQLFRALQKQQRGLAIVLDEFGGTAGLVSMADILGAIVGQIHQTDASAGLVVERLPEGGWRVNGTTRLDDFRREFPALPEVAEVETMGGLLTHLLGIVPERGESAIFGGLKLTAQVVDERRVRELRVQTTRGGA